MIIIYLDSHCCFRAATAAALHLGKISINNPNLISELLHLDFFYSGKEGLVPGYCKKIGNDHWGNEIYILNVAGEAQLIKRSIHDFLRLHNIDPKVFLIVDSCSCHKNKLDIFIYILLRLGFYELAKILAAYYQTKQILKIQKIVNEVIQEFE